MGYYDNVNQESSKKSVCYYCIPMNNRKCTKTKCYTNGGPCCCTTDPKCACTVRVGKDSVPEVADTRVSDAIAFVSPIWSKETLLHYINLYGFVGIYIYLNVLPERTFIYEVAGPLPHNIYYRDSQSTLKGYALAHNIPYFDVANQSRIACRTAALYRECCHRPLNEAIFKIFVYYYAAKQNIPASMRTRITSVLTKNFNDPYKFFEANEANFLSLMNVGQAMIPYILELQKTLFREITKLRSNMSSSDDNF